MENNCLLTGWYGFLVGCLMVFVLSTIGDSRGYAQSYTTVGSDTSKAEVTYNEPFRPQYHFTPKTNWMNDPNGLVYANGRYHLFYQYNPFGAKWGHMSWGHATSRDLIYWNHLSVALREENNVMIFSGSAVWDENNTSGLAGEGQFPVVAVYTGHHTDTALQDQRIAFSKAQGKEWTKYRHNPVIDIGKENFRDPKVFWYEPDERWKMVVALPVERKVQIYESKDLRSWTKLSEFGPAGATGGIWECPELFKLPVQGEDAARWILQVDLGSDAAADGSGGQYFIGSFDGTTFTADSAEYPRWVDYGKDFYAVQSWNNTEDRKVWLAWMNNWQYAEEIPTHPWRGAMTIPRALQLERSSNGFHLVQRPIEELKKLRDKHSQFGNRTISPGNSWPFENRISGNTVEIKAVFEVGDAEEFGLNVRQGDHQKTIIGYNVDNESLFVDRRNSGNTDFHPDFPGVHEGPMPLRNGKITMHIFVDRSSVEVFGNGGRTVITDRIFPDSASRDISLFADGGEVKLVSLDIWKLNSIWQHNE